MEIGSMPFLLVTANVGSVFEDPSRLLKQWIKEFLTKVSMLRPQFVALHLQEVGGKTYDKSMEYVQEFIKLVCDSEELLQYNRIRIFLDEDYNSAEHFTALGNLYFVHKSLKTVKLWNFQTHDWESAEGKSIYTGNIEAVPTKEKAKFPQHFFPECKWSRKGFLRTRWELNCTVIDFINIHLFHDASNLAACEEFPSVYCKTRRRALVHTLERFHKDEKNGVAPYFVFGDFNFRCDTEGVIRKLTEDLTTHRVQNVKNDSTKLQYRNSEGESILTVGKKEFNHANHQIKFKESWLQQFDRELEPLREILVEYPLTFPPSYPYEEDPDMPRNYMSTRCPAWCDRILMSPLARELIVDEAFSSTDYNIIGENVCMGDHKPIYLSVHVKTLQGSVRCCYCHEHASQQKFISTAIVSAADAAAIHLATAANNDVEECYTVNVKNNPAYCLYSSTEFTKILVECHKLLDSYVSRIKSQNIFNNLEGNLVTNSENSSNTNNSCGDRITEQQIPNNKKIMNNKSPLVRINLTDSDNLNICMCSMLKKDSDDIIFNEFEETSNDNKINEKICPKCSNVIKLQSNERRKMLISKSLILTNNIIVNRIDTHYLSTFVDGNLEPYTPESAESRSPCPEFDLLNSQDDLISNNDDDVNVVADAKHLDQLHDNETSIANNTSNVIADKKNVSKTKRKNSNQRTDSRGIVSPGQLKSRLEHLQRASITSESTEFQNRKSKKNRCSNRCCSIL